MGKVTQYFTNFSDTTSTARTVMLWLAIAIVLAYVLTVLLTKGKNKIVGKIFLILGGAYVATSIVLFAVLTGIDNKEDGGVSPLSLYPMIVFAAVTLATAIVFALSKNKTLRICFLIAATLALVAVVVCLVVYYSTGEPGERNWLTEDDVQTVPLWISAVLLIVAVIGLTFIDKRKADFDTRSITYAGVSVALAFALSYVRILKMPMGGAITLASLLPIMLYSYAFGVKKGVIVGAVYGVLQAIQDPFILHPAQFLLDYPVAFAGIGLAGILRSVKLDARLTFTLGALIAASFRLLSSFLSGVFAFGTFASYYDMTSPYLYSITYNAMYILPDAALSIIVGLLLMSSKTVLKMLLTADTKKA